MGYEKISLEGQKKKSRRPTLELADVCMLCSRSSICHHFYKTSKKHSVFRKNETTNLSLADSNDNLHLEKRPDFSHSELPSPKLRLCNFVISGKAQL